VTDFAPAQVEIVVVALDGSEFAQHALAAAERLARRLDAAMLLFSAVGKAEEVDQRRAQLRKLRPRDLTVEVDVLIDADPANALDVVLRDLGEAGVACLASHGRGRSAAIVGSVTHEVLLRRQEPVVVVGHAYDPDRIEARAGKGVVVCVDEEASAEQLLPIALRWSAMIREQPTLLTVAEPVPTPVGPGAVRRAFGPDEDVERFLDRVVARYRAQGFEIATHAVYDPVSPVAGVHDYLLLHPAALVAVGSRPRAGVARAIFGSTASGVVRESTAPVLVIPRTDGT
jgi:nucleotide-binding universal stress UspA family protein